ncbi:hypothetical protein BKA57DRAFT_447793 [Linnemannia elongata]|nr:hypothetical protein BKA57DRAFT_447793 [Linnemannia elongata]
MDGERGKERKHKVYTHTHAIRQCALLLLLVLLPFPENHLPFFLICIKVDACVSPACVCCCFCSLTYIHLLHEAKVPHRIKHALEATPYCSLSLSLALFFCLEFVCYVFHQHTAAITKTHDR